MATDVDEIRYRLARSSDVQAIATLHTDSWRRSYRGMLPDVYLDGDLDTDRAAVWQQRFYDAEGQPVTLTVMAELNGEILGFAHSVSDEDPDWGTLLDNLHVRHATKRLGVGTRLMAETAAWLEKRDDTASLYLWVLEGNVPARQFYDALGGRVVGRGVSHQGGANAPKLRYWWPQLGSVSSLLPQGWQPLA